MADDIRLYNGNNQACVAGLYKPIRGRHIWLPPHCTTDPWEAIEFSFVSSCRHNSRPAIFVVRHDPVFYEQRKTPKHWYFLKKFAETQEERNQQIVQLFTESELEAFLAFGDISTDANKYALKYLIEDLDRKQWTSPQSPEGR